jgi:hypothetical protein
MSNDLHSVLTRVELLFAEKARLSQRGPHLKVIHRFARNDTGNCAPGEEIFAIIVTSRTDELALPLGANLRLFLDYLCRTRHIPQGASHIAAGIRNSEFCRKHAVNARISMRRKIGRSSVKTYIARVRRALDYAFGKLGIPLQATEVLVSEKTDKRETLYRLHASVEWVHLNNHSETVNK